MTSIGDAGQLSAAVRRMQPGDQPVRTELRTNERVLARVTDGIYRRPGSALRELLSNAYDADAGRVAISTDRPRFQRITVSDDGRGMTPEVLEYLLHNIGGSAKRTSRGVELGVVSEADPDLSPGGRRLIGKIGIGLFSVAQLTQSFEISTKVAGDPFSTVASVLLRQYSDSTVDQGDDGTYRAGTVLLWRTPAEQRSLHGTTITLTSVRPQTRDVLQSRELWGKIDAASQGEGRPVSPPMFHIGLINPADPAQARLVRPAEVPWSSGDDSILAMHKFVDAPRRALHGGKRTPLYETIFDEYLQMLWRLGLSLPVPYAEGHPFDITTDDGILTFMATGRAGDEAQSIELAANQRLRDAVPFAAPTEPTGFTISVDDVVVRRPITVGRPPTTSAAFQTPILMVGHYRTEYPTRDIEVSGGPLEFSAYLYWSPKLLPPDHNGVLIRVHEASGTLFDHDFIAFPVNEQRRLSQISCEIFVTEGFDGALNIDRESFNHSHPHVTTVTRWLHNSLRQLIATQKRLSSRAAHGERAQEAQLTQRRLREVVNRVWDQRMDGEVPPRVFLLDAPGGSGVQDGTEDAIVLPRSLLGQLMGRNSDERMRHREEMVEAIAKVLAAYRFFDELTGEEQVDLVAQMFDLVRVYMP